jgi:UDP:flavonoid glycosyltransferase YjiC (YdhE family)
MKTVLIAWELGAGLGHVMRVAALARRCVEQGARVAVALGDLADAHLAAWPEGVRILQAPKLSRPLKGFAGQANYAELIYSCGYHDRALVLSLVRAWRDLFELVCPDVVATDYAPTAQLAARCAGIAQARIGTGFFAPPPVSPLPAFLVREGAGMERMQGAEARTLETVNAVLADAALPAATSLGAALRPDLELIAGWPETDCYAALRPAGSAHYIGNERTGSGAIVAWPDPGVHAKKVFAYLKGDYAHCTALLDALGRSNHALLVYLSNVSEAVRRRYERPNMVLADELIDVAWVAETCDAAICHAGATTSLFLEVGKPVMMLPMQIEQATTAQMIEKLGAGICINDRTLPKGFAGALARLLEHGAYRAAARSVAARWVGKTDPLGDAAELILALPQARPGSAGADPVVAK